MQQQSTLAIAAVMSLLAFLLPRRYFLLPFVLTACLVPTTQRIVIGGLDFTVMRILVMVGVVRMFARGEVTQVKWHAFDKMILVWVFTGAFIYSLQWMDSRAIINRCGVLFDVVGMYWLFRHNMRDWEDIKRMGLFFAACSFVMAALVAMEWTSGQNPYEALGSIATKMRSGRYRCQSSFPHPVMLGLFWATLVPIFIGLAKVQPRKTFYWAATGAAIFVVCGTASSTPVATLYIYPVAFTSISLPQIRQAGLLRPLWSLVFIAYIYESAGLAFDCPGQYRRWFDRLASLPLD